jgi:hypothetical protein
MPFRRFSAAGSSGQEHGISLACQTERIAADKAAADKADMAEIRKFEILSFSRTR